MVTTARRHVERCPVCRSTDLMALPTLDGTEHWACRVCGHEWTITTTEETP